MYTQNMSEETSLKLKRMKRENVFDEVMFKAVNLFWSHGVCDWQLKVSEFVVILQDYKNFRYIMKTTVMNLSL